MKLYIKADLRSVVRVGLADKTTGCILDIDPTELERIRGMTITQLIDWEEGRTALKDIPEAWKTDSGKPAHVVFGHEPRAVVAFPVDDAVDPREP